MANAFDDLSREDLIKLQSQLSAFLGETQDEEPAEGSVKPEEPQDESLEHSEENAPSELVQEPVEGSLGDVEDDPVEEQPLEDEEGSEEGEAGVDSLEEESGEEEPEGDASALGEGDELEDFLEEEDEVHPPPPNPKPAPKKRKSKPVPEDDDDEDDQEELSSRSKRRKAKKKRKDEEEEEKPKFLSPASFSKVQDRLDELDESGELTSLAWEIVPPDDEDDVPFLRFYDENSDVTVLSLALTERVARRLRDAMTSSLLYYKDERLEKRRAEERERLRQMNGTQRAMTRSKSVYKRAHKRFGLFATIGAVFFGLILVVVLSVSAIAWVVNSDMFYAIFHRG